MYATINQADEYVEQYYSSTDPIRLAWGDLFEEDKQVLLNRAEQTIDSLPLKGCPSESGKAFPRTPFRELSMHQAMVATVELALSALDTEAEERLKLRRQGVKSYRIGDLSETFSDTIGKCDSMSHALSVVAPYLSNWLNGGYNLCATRIRK